MITLLFCLFVFALAAQAVASARWYDATGSQSRGREGSGLRSPAPLPASKTVTDLNRGLAHTPMRGLGLILVQEGRRRNVSPYLIAAVAGLESSYGAAPCRSNPRNVWGLASCKRGYGIPVFRSWRQAVRFQAGLLRRGWLSKGVRDVYTIGRSYCPPCKNKWGADVGWFMRDLGGTTKVTYR